MLVTNPWRRCAAALHRRALEQELADTLTALRANDGQFQQATEPWYIEQVVYEHAALLCRCSALLRELRKESAPCPR